MRSLLLAALLLFSFVACSEDDPDPAPAKVCSPGKQEACACPGGGQGAQVCKDDGSGYGACTPCSVGAGGAGGSAGGAGAAGAPELGPGCVYDKLKQEGCSVNPTPNKPTPYVGCFTIPDACVLSKSPPHADIGVVCCPPLK